MKMEAETGVMRLQNQKCQEIAGATSSQAEARKDSGWLLQREHGPANSDFRHLTSRLRE